MLTVIRLSAAHWRIFSNSADRCTSVFVCYKQICIIGIFEKNVNCRQTELSARLGDFSNRSNYRSFPMFWDNTSAKR